MTFSFTKNHCHVFFQFCGFGELIKSSPKAISFLAKSRGFYTVCEMNQDRREFVSDKAYRRKKGEGEQLAMQARHAGIACICLLT